MGTLGISGIISKGNKMFKDAKINDKVFDYTLQEWGVVIDINMTYNYPLSVQFKEEIRTYTLDGREFLSDKTPVLFWYEIKPITPPKKSLPKLKVDTKVLVWDENIANRKQRYFSHFDEDGVIYCFNFGSTSWSNDDERPIAWKHWELVEDENE